MSKIPKPSRKSNDARGSGCTHRFFAKKKWQQRQTYRLQDLSSTFWFRSMYDYWPLSSKCTLHSRCRKITYVTQIEVEPGTIHLCSCSLAAILRKLRAHPGGPTGDEVWVAQLCEASKALPCLVCPGIVAMDALHPMSFFAFACRSGDGWLCLELSALARVVQCPLQSEPSHIINLLPRVELYLITFSWSLVR